MDECTPSFGGTTKFSTLDAKAGTGNWMYLMTIVTEPLLHPLTDYSNSLKVHLALQNALKSFNGRWISYYPPVDRTPDYLESVPDIHLL